MNTTNNFVACYFRRSDRGELTFNLRCLGRRWFDQGATEEVDRPVIHEFGHHFSGDHLSEAYHEALCLLGAKLKRLAMEKPEEVRRFVR
ncbi:MAG: hypothetical protein HYX68_16165 [Planctomycetes bacterium]|nr:hypothetical protein [Planctomycetota bacterium]